MERLTSFRFAIIFFVSFTLVLGKIDESPADVLVEEQKNDVEDHSDSASLKYDANNETEYSESTDEEKQINLGDKNDLTSSVLAAYNENEHSENVVADQESSLQSRTDVIESNNNSVESNENSTAIQTNATLTEPNRSDAAYKIYSNCLTDKVYGIVEVVNATRLMELFIDPISTSKTENKKENTKASPRTCLLVLFYSRWCVFSSQAAPHFNALPRFYPHIKIVAIDASKYQNFNTQFGIVGVPTLMFVYKGKPLVKFNDTSYTLESFARFVTEYTALKPNGSLFVTSADFSGPVPSTPSNETDYCLVLSWIFIAACAIYFTLQSQWWRQFVELVQNTWRESNAQHEHTD